MKRLYYYIIAITGIFLTSCDHIAENERLIYEKPEQAQRVVLLEDFTGQRCVNCPKATDVIEQLQKEYGEEHLVAVSIHGGPLGFAGNAKTTGLATETGDAYYNHWKLEYQPIGLINRQAPVNYPEWSAMVKQELAKPTTLELMGMAVIDEGQIDISITALGTDGETIGKLQIWLVEDSIQALQLMPDGTSNHEYIHNHVLRTPVNGIWGEDFTLQEGVSANYNYRLEVNSLWNPNHLGVVAFVYNDKGVCQTTQFEVSDER